MRGHARSLPRAAQFVFEYVNVFHANIIVNYLFASNLFSLP